MIELFNVNVSESSINLAVEVLKSTMLNEGKYVDAFEESLSAHFGIENPVAVNSCTSALHLSLVCAGVKQGDEVILPPQTFIASGLSILMAGGKPVFCDIDPETGNIDPKKIEPLITEKTRVIMPVHWGGMPADIPTIRKIAKRHNLIVVEDAAHALGASINDQMIGAISEYTCFSFQTIKFITTGDGGAIGTNSRLRQSELIRRRWFGFDRTKMKKHPEGDRDYPVTELGFKYHMNNIAAAIGLGAMGESIERFKARQRNARLYRTILKETPGVTLLKLPQGYMHAFWLFTIRVENRTAFIRKMQEAGIRVSVCDRRIDKHPIFGGTTEGLTGQELFDETQISIPVHDGLTDDDLDKIIFTIQQGW